MAGISDKALKGNYAENKIRFQKQELQSKEFSDGSGLEMYEFKYRMDDPQIGRFWSIDPLSNKYVYNSTYAFSENKVTSHVELEGLEAGQIINSFWRAVEGELHTAAKNVDDNIGAGASLSVEKPITSKTDGVVNTLTHTLSFDISTHFDDYLSYLITNNTNAGYQGSLATVNGKNDYSVGTKIEGTTPIGSVSVKQSVNQDKVGTTTAKATVNTASGVNPTVTASQSTDGTKKIGAGISSSSGNTTGSATATVTRKANGNTNVELRATVEQKVNDIKISGSLYLRFGHR